MKNEKLILDLWRTINHTKLFYNDEIRFVSLFVIFVRNRMSQDRSDDFLVPFSLVKLADKIDVVLYKGDDFFVES